MDREENKNGLSYLFGKTWQYSEGNHFQVVVYWVMFIISEVFNSLMTPLVWAKMIEILTVEGVNDRSIGRLEFCLVLLIVRMAVSWAFHGPARCLERSNAFMARANYSRYLLRGVLTLPLEWHNEHHSGDTTDKVNKSTHALFDFAEESYSPIKNSFQLLISFGALTYFSTRSGVVVFVLMLVSVWITMRFDRVLMEQYHELNLAENRINESIVDAIGNISTIIVLRVEKLVFEAIMHRIEKPFALFKKNQILSEWKWALTSVCANLMTALSVLIFFFEHFGAVPGELVASFFLLTQYLDRIGELFYQFTSMYGGVVQRKSRVMNGEKLAHDFRAENFVNHVLPENWQTLEVRNLSFSYKGSDDDLNLRKVSLSFKRGEKIGLVGETGSGKSTLLRLMRDLYHPKHIELSADSQLIPTGFEGISRAITLVQQDPEIFARTIFENITLGTEQELSFVKKFTDMACFTEVAENLPKGFDSVVNEKGVNLSGGEQQRLALSRGLLACHDKSIVLLDEPTSSLDAVTELKVYRQIFAAFSDKTIISTIHQLNLVPLFDRICVFHAGQIVGTGTLEELLCSCPQFVRLWGAHKS